MWPSGRRARHPDASGASGRCRVLLALLGRTARREGWRWCAGQGYRLQAQRAGVAQSRLSAAFWRAPLFQSAKPCAFRPFKAPHTIASPLFAARRSAQPAAPDTDRFIRPPAPRDVSFCPPARWPRDTPERSPCCVALRAPRPLFAGLATRCQTSSPPSLFKSRRRRCGCPPLGERFDNFRLAPTTSGADTIQKKEN